MSFDGLSTIGQVMIPVTDLQRATNFYKEVLGIPHLFSAPPQLAFFQAGAVRLMLSMPEGEESYRGGVIYYKVDGLDEVCGTLKGRGTRFDDEPHLIAKMPDHELWMAFLRDSENNVIGLMEERR